ncbi:MAG: hypothetical protein QXO40_05135 [Candidatus Aenigmatarchaeota archaeon]
MKEEKKICSITNKGGITLFLTPITEKIARNVENVIFNIHYLTKYPNDIKRCFYAKRVILDSGIAPFFEKMKLKEYPKEYLENYYFYAIKIARKIKEKNPECIIWVVIPDYPADVPDNPIENNVERTIENWLRFKDINTKDIFTWMPSLQAKKLDIESFLYSIKKFKEIFGENYPVAGIGSICKWKDVKLIEKYCRIARENLPNTWLHGFGPTVKALKYIWRYINSFDSITITYHLKNSKGAEDVWNKYMKKFYILNNFGLLLNYSKNKNT